MTNLHEDNQQNLVRFLRHNQAIPPLPQSNLEQIIIDSLEPQKTQRNQEYLAVTRTIINAIARNTPIKLIATGFLFTSVSFGFKTPRIAIEPKDLENFLVNNWQNTLDKSNSHGREEAEAYWLLPTVSQTQPALSVSAQ